MAWSGTAGGGVHRDRSRITRQELMPHLSPTSGEHLNRGRDDLLARAWESIEAYGREGRGEGGGEGPLVYALFQGEELRLVVVPEGPILPDRTA